MAIFFGLGGKYHHSGLDMWFNSRDGIVKDQKEMVNYCNVDVIRTKDVLYKLLPYMKQFNDFQAKHDIDIICSNPLCRSTKLVRAKRRYTVNGVKQQWQCKDCFHYTQGKDFIQ